MDSIKVFSPGSVTNLSCGYDVLGVCLENRGDEIEVHKTNSIGLEIESLDNYNISNKIDRTYCTFIKFFPKNLVQLFEFFTNRDYRKYALKSVLNFR